MQSILSPIVHFPLPPIKGCGEYVLLFLEDPPARTPLPITIQPKDPLFKNKKIRMYLNMLAVVKYHLSCLSMF